MSTIATTPLSAPSSSGTKPLVIGLGVVALVMTGVVVAQNVDLPTSTTTSSTSTEVRAGGPDAIENQARSAAVRAGGPDALGARAAAEAARVERQLDGLVKTQGNYAGLVAGAAAAYAVPRSLVASQVGGMHGSYAFTGTSGRPSSVEQSQVGGEHGTYGYTPNGTHTVWNDSFVPPYQDPEWMPLIQKHFFGAGSGE